MQMTLVVLKSNFRPWLLSTRTSRSCGSSSINYEDSVARLVAAALPDLTAAECRSRAELVIALIEGTTMQFEPKSVAAQKRHTKRVIDLAERIVFE